MIPQEAFDQLSYYTLSHMTEEFMHQYVVDAFAVQMADENTKPIKLNFGLIGLYLHLEKKYTGRQVQKAHMQLARYKNKLPHVVVPNDRGKITVFDVLKIPEGEERDKKIEEWMTSVWNSYEESQSGIKDFLDEYLF